MKRRQKNGGEDNLDNNVAGNKPRRTAKKRNKKEELSESQPKSTVASTRRYKLYDATDDAKIREYFTMSCDICNEPFETFRTAQKHYRAVHKSPGYIICCGKRFKRRGSAMDHISYHLNPDLFRCEPCGKRFSDKNALKLHIENHEPMSSRAHKCDLCPSSFTKGTTLMAHKRQKHSRDEDKTFHCDKCDKK